MDPNALHGSCDIKFIGEHGYDAGGLTREWLENLFEKIIDPSYGLFTTNDSGSVYYPNENSVISPYHLNYYKFLGKIMGKALSQ